MDSLYIDRVAFAYVQSPTTHHMSAVAKRHKAGSSMSSC